MGSSWTFAVVTQKMSCPYEMICWDGISSKQSSSTWKGKGDRYLNLTFLWGRTWCLTCVVIRMEAAEWSMSSTPDYLVIRKWVCRHISPILTSRNCIDLMRYSGSADLTRTPSLASETTSSATIWIWKNCCSLFAERLFVSRSFAWGASAWWSNSLTDITKCRRWTFNSQRSCKCWTPIPQRSPGSSSFWSSRSSRAAKTWSSWKVRKKQVALH